MPVLQLATSGDTPRYTADGLASRTANHGFIVVMSPNTEQALVENNQKLLYKVSLSKEEGAMVNDDYGGMPEFRKDFPGKEQAHVS